MWVKTFELSSNVYNFVHGYSYGDCSNCVWMSWMKLLQNVTWSGVSTGFRGLRDRVKTFTSWQKLARTATITYSNLKVVRLHTIYIYVLTDSRVKGILFCIFLKTHKYLQSNKFPCVH